MIEPTIPITLKINHALEGFIPRHMIDKDMRMTVKKGTNVNGMIREVIGLSKKVVPLVLVNGHHAKPLDVLKSGDRVTLWMPMAGG